MVLRNISLFRNKGWNEVIFKVLSNSSHSMILWFYEYRCGKGTELPRVRPVWVAKLESWPCALCRGDDALCSSSQKIHKSSREKRGCTTGTPQHFWQLGYFQWHSLLGSWLLTLEPLESRQEKGCASFKTKCRTCKHKMKRGKIYIMNAERKRKEQLQNQFCFKRNKQTIIYLLLFYF